MRNQIIGKRGEKIAVVFLKKKGYRILETGVHAGKLGELDIIAVEGKTLVFVEVKTRNSSKYGLPEESVSPAKQRRLVNAIHWYRQSRGLERWSYRLDVIAIDSEIRHHKAIELTF